ACVGKCYHVRALHPMWPLLLGLSCPLPLRERAHWSARELEWVRGTFRAPSPIIARGNTALPSPARGEGTITRARLRLQPVDPRSLAALVPRRREVKRLTRGINRLCHSISPAHSRDSGNPGCGSNLGPRFRGDERTREAAGITPRRSPAEGQSSRLWTG